jgi:eukaryotic-like serine/threonine-protein kinase
MSSTNPTFGGRYSVIDKAGTGGMAEVYRARDELLGREVAVKVLSARLSTDSTFVERFRREAQAAANLNHPNVVSLYDFGADGNTYYIVMEFIDGKPLADIIQSDGPLMPERAAEIAIDVARALERAHQAGLVHRDIKPSNIMMNSSGQTKVTDFGIARALSREGDQTMTQTGMVIGTAAYLSPEQAQGNPVDQRSDVYSLGCVLYEMLGGRPPFTGDTPLSVAYRHVRENADPPSKSNPDVPKAMDAIVMKALAKNPDNRYQTATEFREDLERFLAGQKVMATPLLPATAVAQQSGTRVMAAGDEPPHEPESSKKWPWIVLGLLALAGLLAFLFLGPLASQTVETPDLTGMSREEATNELDQFGLAAEFERQPHPDAPVGEVVDQDPDPGDEVDEGGTVTVFLSSGPQPVKVPDLSNEMAKDAKEILEEAGLELGETTKQPNEDVEKGLVISQSIDPGEKVDPETPVDIVVSSGPAPVIVPDVINQTQEQAETNIDAAGLAFEVREEFSDEVAEGIVFDQDPDPFAEVPPDSVVTIFVSLGSEPFEMPNVIGEEASAARATLEAEGLLVTETEQACSPGIDPGHVCDTDPPAGEEVVSGDSVELFIQPELPPEEGEGD